LVLQGVETYAKTGLLLVQQDVQRVELYFRDGRLMCIGPVRPDMTLRDRLLRAGVISSSALQDTSAALDIAQSGETRIALTLMDLGYISHEDLRAWAMKEASGVIQVLLTWPGGEIYFEDGMQPPADRLLVALSPCSLLPSTQSATTPANNTQDEAGEVRLQNRQPQNELMASVQTQSAGLLSASQLITETPPISASFPSPVSSVRTVNMFGDADAQNFPQLSPPMRISQPLPPLRIDTSFMRPEMVLMPLDLSALRQQGLHLPITPEQWFVLTRVDGRTTLQCACLELGMPADMLCQVAGELIALGVIHVSIPLQQVSMNELPPVSRDLISPATNNDSVSNGYVTITPQPWVAITSTTDSFSPSFGVSVPFETMSQWGNGGNGATFVPGRGWVANPQPVQLVQPVQPSGPLYATNGVYAPIGSGR